MSEFCTGQSAAEVHSALKSALIALEKAQQCAVLWFGEIMDRRLYRELGYSSIQLYATTELGFSKTRTNDFILLCRKLKNLPLVKDKLESGELGYTKARALVPVVDKSNEKGWVDFAVNNSRREVEQEVKRAKKQAVDKKAAQPPLIATPQKRPAAVVSTRVSFEMSPTQLARFEKQWERIRKQGGVPGDKVEAFLEIIASYAPTPRGVSEPPVQIHVHQCPDCETATVATSRGELELSNAERKRAHCDCQISRPGERNTASIAPAVRREVLARYRHKCQRPGCTHSGYLEVHHVVPRAEGGSNDLQNLTCLCSACHSLLHERNLGGKGFGVREEEVVYHWFRLEL